MSFLDILSSISSAVKGYGDTSGVLQGVDDAKLRYEQNTSNLDRSNLQNDQFQALLDTYNLEEPVRGAKRDADVLLQNLDSEKRRDAIDSTKNYRNFYNNPEFAGVFGMDAGPDRTAAMADLLRRNGLGKEAEQSQQTAFKAQDSDAARALQMFYIAPSEATASAVNEYMSNTPVAKDFMIEMRDGKPVLVNALTDQETPLTPQNIPLLGAALLGNDPNFGVKSENFMSAQAQRGATTNKTNNFGSMSPADRSKMQMKVSSVAETEVAK